MKKTPPSYALTRLFFQRAMGGIYFLAFLGTALQFRGLIGAHGLLPAFSFVDRIHFWDSPGLFWFFTSDAFMGSAAWLGVGLSALVISGWSERRGALVSAAVWSLLWLLYLSFVNAGQVFYSFGWETMTLETGFLAIFLGPRETRPPAQVIWFLRWELFRLMFGAGMIKLHGDPCWCDFTCMYYHYQTQPIPNPLSWYFHHMSRGTQKFQTFSTMALEIVVPWFYFAVRPLCYLAGILTIGFQGCLILSGNLSWLNYLTIVITIPCFDDAFFAKCFRLKIPEYPSPGRARRAVTGTLTALILCLSVGPALNLFSPHQMMNASFEPLHLVNTYGAFGTVTRERPEIILEGTTDAIITPATVWREYEFKAKPGNVHRMPPLVAPYHLRLDWLMWFASMGDWRYHPWTLHLVEKLLQGDQEVLGLMGKNPFPDAPPRYIRAVLYQYRFTTPEEKKRTGDWWVREKTGDYLPVMSLDNAQFRYILRRLGWE